ncbi:hypothetical protein [Streptomyces sp. C10-9-1]|uniref:hypothetical protein n=1 Tax=Streptomyces sp. C10-9-1 TaxID=1859285 RepID=UPI003F49F840
MFEIRVICDPSDTHRIVAALDDTFTAGTVSVYPASDGRKDRFYLTAEHRETAETWPTPEQAYALAPSIISEIGWTAQRAREAMWPLHSAPVREFWLRKAALLDRVALSDTTVGAHTDAPEAALNAARKLLDADLSGSGYGGTPYWPDHPEAIADPRGYVRQEYGLWAKHQ